MRWIDAIRVVGIIALGVHLGLNGIDAAAADKADPAVVLDTLASTIAAERAAQARGGQWEKERLRLEEEIRQARLEEAWYDRQAAMLEAYVRTAEARIAGRQEALETVGRMDAELHGLLTDVVGRLQAFVAGDIPFLREERARRLEFLQSSLADYELSSAEKLRRVLEALQAELGYGRDVQPASAMEMLDGAPRAVNLVRIGRVGLYAVTPDGQQAWHWTRDQGFVPLDAASRRGVAEIVADLEKKQPRSLPVLPLDAALVTPGGRP